MRRVLTSWLGGVAPWLPLNCKLLKWENQVGGNLRKRSKQSSGFIQRELFFPCDNTKVICMHAESLKRSRQKTWETELESMQHLTVSSLCGQSSNDWPLITSHATHSIQSFLTKLTQTSHVLLQVYYLQFHPHKLSITFSVLYESTIQCLAETTDVMQRSVLGCNVSVSKIPTFS